MKRAIIITLLLMLFLLPMNGALALDTSNAKYSGSIVITNNGTIAANHIAVPFTANTSVFVVGDYMFSSANNTAVTLSGSNLAYMPAADNTTAWMVLLPNINGNQVTTGTLFMGGNTDMSGKRRYFPSDSGMTTPDDAGLELGDNFTVSISGYLNTDAGPAKNIVMKNSAFALSVSANVSGNITAEVSSNLTVTQDVETSFFGLKAPTTRVGENITTIRPRIINSVQFKLQKVGSPSSATANITIRSQADDSLIGIIDTIDVSTVNSSMDWHVFNASPVTISTPQDILVLFEWAGGDASHFIRMGTSDPTNEYANGNAVRYISGAYTNDSYDASFRMETQAAGVTVTATNVTSGEHSINVTANVTHLTMSIDGALQDTANLTSPVSDTTGNWTFLQNNSVTYLNSQNISINGVLQQGCIWSFGDAVISDISGNNHDCTPSYRTVSTSANVSAVLNNFKPINEADAPAYTINQTVYDFVTDNISAGGAFHTSGNTSSDLLGPVRDVSNETNTPVQLPLFLLTGFTVLTGSMGVTYLMRENKSRSLFLQIVTIIVIMGVAVAMSIIDEWMIILLIPIILGLAMSSGTTFVGTGITGNNTFGFLVMMFLGLTIINRILEGQIILGSDLSTINNFLAFQPFSIGGWFSIPVPNLSFLTTGIPALLNWDEYTYLAGNAQYFMYLLYSISAVVAFILFTLALGAAYQMFSRVR